MPAVVGTAPVMTRHLILHSNHEPKTWPSHLESTSEVYKELGKRASGGQQLAGLGFNLSDAGVTGASRTGDSARRVDWDRSRSRFEDPPTGQEEE